jgi:pimeloyl-ACP methyl ester carboxylesterase
MRGRSIALAAAVALMLLPLAARPGEAAADARAPLTWETCHETFECATLAVPLDHADPDGTQISIALIRMPARNPAARIGSVVVSPGIFASSGVDAVRLGGQRFAALNERFDVVGFDLRGTGASDPLAICMTWEEERVIEPPLVAYPPVTVRPDREVEAEAYISACEQRSGELLPHLSTTDVARDLDVLRAALGDEQLTFLGLSYGTVIGTYYAALFPERVRAVALDSGIDVAGYVHRPLLYDEEQLAATERVLQQFFAWCAATPGLCPFGGGQPAAAFDQLIARLETNRQAHPGRHDVMTGGLLLSITNGYLLEPASWPAFAQLLVALEQQPLPTVPLPTGYNLSSAAYLSVTCLDRNVTDNMAVHDLHFLVSARVSPHFGRLFGFSEIKCGRWPVEDEDRFQGPWRYTGETPALVVATTGDPVAPYRWSGRLVRQLGNARLLTLEGWGHASFGRGSTCVDEQVTSYLVDLTLPDAGAACDLPLPPDSGV